MMETLYTPAQLTKLRGARFRLQRLQRELEEVSRHLAGVLGADEGGVVQRKHLRNAHREVARADGSLIETLADVSYILYGAGVRDAAREVQSVVPPHTVNANGK